MDNCQLEKLLCDNSGFVSHCRGCGTLHIGFGNFLITCPLENLAGFVKGLETAHWQNSQKGHHPNLKNIVVPTPAREVSLLFCLEELRQFILLLKTAGNKVTVKKLASEISGGKGAALN